MRRVRARKLSRRRREELHQRVVRVDERTVWAADFVVVGHEALSVVVTWIISCLLSSLLRLLEHGVQNLLELDRRGEP
jgi:hypothetical protein